MVTINTLKRPHNLLLPIRLHVALDIEHFNRFFLLAEFDDASIDLGNLTRWLVDDI